MRWVGDTRLRVLWSACDRLAVWRVCRLVWFVAFRRTMSTGLACLVDGCTAWPTGGSSLNGRDSRGVGEHENNLCGGLVRLYELFDGLVVSPGCRQLLAVDNPAQPEHVRVFHERALDLAVAVAADLPQPAAQAVSDRVVATVGRDLQQHRFG